MSWWSDLGGLLGLGSAWTPLDWLIAMVAVPIFAVVGGILGRKVGLWIQSMESAERGRK